MEPDLKFLDHLIAAAALLLSGIALIVSIRVQRRTAPLLDRQIAAHDQAAAARQQAALIAERDSDEMWKGGRKRYTLFIRNNGPAQATNITIRLEPDVPIPGARLPVQALASGGRVEIASLPHAGPFQATVTWTDPSGNREQRMTVG